MHNPIPQKGGHTKRKTAHLHVLREVECLGGPPQVGGQRLLQLLHRGLDGQPSGAWRQLQDSADLVIIKVGVVI